MALVADALDPKFWYKKFENNHNEVAFVKSILLEAGL